MNNYSRITPEGTLDLLFEECAARDRVAGQLSDIFVQRGYRKVATPALEFFDAFGGYPQEEMHTLTDGQGRLLVLRPDCTVPIARLTATRLAGQPLPLRLYYSSSVYRRSSGQRGQLCEIPQTGVELIGCDSAASDLEVVELAAQGLTLLGGHGRIELCHIGYFRSLMDSLPAQPEVKEQIRQSIEQKNYAALTELLSPYSGPAAQALLSLPRLFGGQEVLDRAAALFDQGGAGEALASLRILYGQLCAQGLGSRVLIDLGLVNQADYYTGLIFRGYCRGAGEPVLSGGRYDNLHGEFGRELPAVGFAFNLDLAARTQAADAPTHNRPLRIALTKGRLEKKSLELFKALGVDCASLEDKGRRLILPLGNGMEVVLAKAADVVTFVENGVCDLGVVGKDTIMEMGGSFFEVADLGFGRCRFALAQPAGADFYSGYQTKRVGSKYVNVARRYFEKQNLDVTVIKIEGSVELAPLLGLADAIVDLVETGDTLRENGLVVAEDICPVSARLIVNTASLKLRREELEPFIAQVEAYLGGNKDD